jgi:hypothetical protein
VGLELVFKDEWNMIGYVGEAKGREKNEGSEIFIMKNIN